VDNQATVLCCTPTYALRLGEVAAEEGIDLKRSNVRVIVVAGEAGGSIAATRARIEQIWPGARVFDHHGMTEVGAVTYECPVHPGNLHVMEQAYFAEIIEPGSDQPAAEGQPGELVLTPLGRIASPVLRYRTGDLVKRRTGNGERQTACKCGRYDLLLEGGILGRVDDMVIVRGVNVHPSAVEAIVRGVDGIAEYQVRLTKRGPLAEMRLAIELEPGGVDAGEIQETLRQLFQSSLSLQVVIDVVASGTLPRFEMKAKRWIRE
jgi:phenylacetate-CoA ligase